MLIRGMTIRRHFIIFLARLLRVKLYNHWSEVPIDPERPGRPGIDYCKCSKAGCIEKATVNMSGSPFCDAHQYAIRKERRRSGKTGPVAESEGMLKAN
jgi:hypothetical protein